MALCSLHLERFRAFGLRARLELRPLTLVFGYNSQGKSALIRALPLLAASVRNDASDALEVRSPAARGASFEELMSKYGHSPSVNFGLTWDDEDLPLGRIEIALRSGGVGRPQIVERLSCFDHADVPLLSLVAKLEDDATDDSSTYEATLEGALAVEIRLQFRGLVPSAKTTPETPPLPGRLEATLQALRQRLRSLDDSVHWLAAVRRLPDRRGELRGRPPRIGHDGEHADEQLAFAATRDRAVLEEVETFYRQVTDHDLIVEDSRVAETAGFILSLRRRGDGPECRVNLLDTGEGMAQVLPVAVLSALAKHGYLGKAPLVIIEHPELHLHPRAHGRLAAWLCQLAASSDVRFLIETHSENFLSRVQLAVVDDEIPATKVLLNWIDWHEEGAAVRVVHIDEFAALDGWPESVFGEDTALHREILIARRKRVKKGEGESPRRE